MEIIIGYGAEGLLVAPLLARALIPGLGRAGGGIDGYEEWVW